MGDFISGIAGSLDFFNLRMPKLEVSSILDMAIVAYLLYKILVWIAKTRAWILFRGIFSLAIVYFLAEALKLHTISWIVSNTFSMGLIAIIIIFQPEIRKALEQIGKGTIGNKILGGSQDSNDELVNCIEEVISACRKMSKERTGALIVMENQVPLGDIGATGISLDAVVTNQLLISIFEDKMPLHDGAVIISKNRIAAAGCILPLTQTEIGYELGTRHRAAVGVSEVSDANIVVVSNETGYVSIANGGKLYKNLNDDEIRSMLSGNKKPPRGKLTSIFKGRRLKNGGDS